MWGDHVFKWVEKGGCGELALKDNSVTVLLKEGCSEGRLAVLGGCWTRVGDRPGILTEHWVLPGAP